MPGPTPPRSRPAGDRPTGETTALVTQVVDELTRRLAADAVQCPESPGAAGEARRRALARLRILAGVKEAVRHLEDQAAHVAATSGAGYPEIGQALGMSRQGARRRWPGLVTGNTRNLTFRPTPRSS
ncbi:hypothetical protein AB0C59_02835 [Streptomyces sp. NPDC048664]|uniref:hypothetical protein n=1 Tax=Streptomyces sp. NPDC048664 TaxID=3154505 RepID=UPI00342DF070